jgi:hypothetical protein
MASTVPAASVNLRGGGAMGLAGAGLSVAAAVAAGAAAGAAPGAAAGAAVAAGVAALS